MINNMTYNNQLQPNAISPNALSNQDAVQGVFGQANQGTFTRTVGNAAIGQMPNQEMDASGNSVGYGNAQMPPSEVQTPITPTYDLNNL